jgi:hypothetical protein
MSPALSERTQTRARLSPLAPQWSRTRAEVAHSAPPYAECFTWTTPSRRQVFPHSRSPEDYLDLAKSDSATEEQPRWLGSSPYSFVLEAVARNPATPGDVLEQLVPSNAKSWNDQSLLLALAEHPASSAAVLASIARQLPPLLHERGAHPGFAAGIALS